MARDDYFFRCKLASEIIHTFDVNSEPRRCQGEALLVLNLRDFEFGSLRFGVRLESEKSERKTGLW